MLIVITGTDGSGKGSVVGYLVAQHQFVHYSAREVLLEYIRAADLPQTREQMRLTANEFRAQHGDDFLVQRVLAITGSDPSVRVIIESIRALAEAKTLHNAGGVLLAVDADPQIRYARIQSRQSESDYIAYEAFLAHEELEKNDPDPHGMQKAAVMDSADYTFINNGTLEGLYKQVEAFITTTRS